MAGPTCIDKQVRSRDWRLFLVPIMLVFLASACVRTSPTRRIEILHVAILPDQSEMRIRERYAPLVEHLREHAGFSAELRIPGSYEELLQWFRDREVDLVLFGGITYVQAHLQSGAVPLVIRDVDGRSRSVLLVKDDSSARTIRDLKGLPLAFGDRLSTTGHVMPRYFFGLLGIEPETYFGDIFYSGAHDLTAEWVRDGRIAAGISNSGIVAEMYADGRLKSGQLRILWESPPLADYVWAVPSDMSREDRSRIRDSFLHMNYRPEDAGLLRKLGASFYLPVDHADFAILEDYLRRHESTGVTP
ncbi:MAG TPA: phosphate/phosphite/phosphonate ABC transporter substrate-binding protein [Gammaproteobacteria bacterium]|nr:phosphate/phosphite/phosphonate ABC transporter substrate-binding protein [Gammaproteobacteria bacterium]